jgi:uncharacterized protein YcbK (DUF882 family)
MHRLASAIAAVIGAAFVASPVPSPHVRGAAAAVDATVGRSSGLASKKASAAAASAEPPGVFLGTLVQTHTDERVPLDERSPTPERLAELLADRITGERHDFDPKLLELLRSLARKHPAARFELVSGYRSPKLNEMMRKKGHHVASHSQHSLGHAVDFRLVEGGETKGIDPRVLEREIRDLGWEGGVGVYTLASDWFVHADVGRQRRWDG